MKAKAHNTVFCLALGVACLTAPATAATGSAIKLAGAIAGVVSDPSGIPQMGATVVLFNKQDRPVQRLQTDDHGQFHFSGLFPDLYSVRVSLATFFPAFKRGILVQPGMRSLLNVNLSGLFSTIQLTYPEAIENGGVMSEDWKWVLRSAASTRPVLRLLDKKPAPARTADTSQTSHFSDTRGVLKVSGGALADAVSNQADLGTAFALASTYGNTLLQVSGDLGYGSQTGAPATAFRTSFSRNFAGGNPEVSLTMRQLYMPMRIGPALAGNDSAMPMLRSMTAGLEDKKQIADNVTLQYGFRLDSVTFLDHLNYFSPYSRLTWSTPDGGELMMAYTSGDARPDLGGNPLEDSDLQRDLSTLGQFPRVSLYNSRPQIQRGNEYEIAYSRKAGSRTYRVSAYYEQIDNATLSAVAPGGAFLSGDLLPDLFTGNSIFNIGEYHNSGANASVTQDFGEHVSATLILGSEGALGVQGHELVSNSPDEVRAMFRAGRRDAATLRVTATVPRLGTRVIASYQWAPSNAPWLMAGDLYSTQEYRPLPGLNLHFRQPLPHGGLPWRMEATADIRNMLAQGYYSMGMTGGQSMLLVDAPRCFRGGLSFIF